MRTALMGAAAAALVVGVVVPVPAQAAPFTWPEDVPGGWSNGWPTCATAEQQYCVESAVIGDTPVANSPSGIVSPGERTVHVYRLDDSYDAPSSLNWAIQGAPGNPTWTLPDADAGQVARIVLRVGTFPVRYTSATSDGISVDVAQTDVGNGYHSVTITGSPTRVNWGLPDGVDDDSDADSCLLDSCGDDATQAQYDGVVFSGNSQDMGSSGWDGDRDRFTGMAIASNAMTTAPVVGFVPDPDPQNPEDRDLWTFQLASPHLALGGGPASGSFTAQVPAAYFATIGRTADDTVFAVGRDDGATQTTVGSETAVHPDGSATLRIADLHYSTPELKVSAQDAPPPPRDPGQTAAPVATAGVRSATVTWNAPSDVGSSPITAYVLQRRSSGDVTWQPLGSVPALPRSVTVRNLSGGVFQQFRVAARNSVGLGPWSATSNAVIPYAPPGAPGQPRATAKPGKVVALTWPAAAAHGAAVTYTVQTASATGAWSNRATTTRLSWSGAFTTAKVGQVRRFRIVPHNRAGWGPASAQVRATLR